MTRPATALRPDATPSREPSIAELQAAADHARQRLALYRRRIYVGGGNLRRLAELEREADGAAARLGRAVSAEGVPGTAQTLPARTR